MKPPNKPSTLAIRSLRVTISLRIARCSGTRTAASVIAATMMPITFLGYVVSIALQANH